MAYYNRLIRATPLVSARRFSQLNAIRPIVRISQLNQTKTQWQPQDRFLAPATTAIRTLRLRLGGARHESSAAAAVEEEKAAEVPPPKEIYTSPILENLSPEAKAWTLARPRNVTKWENAVCDLYGPDFKSRLSDEERDMLAKIVARRELIESKWKELLNEEEYQEAEKQFQSIMANGRFVQRAAGAEDRDATRPLRRLEVSLAQFIPDDAVWRKACAVLDLFYQLQKRDHGRSQAQSLVANEWELETVEQRRAKGIPRLFMDFTELRASNLAFVRRLSKRVASLSEAEKTPETMEVKLKEAAHETLVAFKEEMTDEQLDDFIARCQTWVSPLERPSPEVLENHKRKSRKPRKYVKKA